MSGTRKKVFEGGFGKYLLPGILLQSVLLEAAMQQDVRSYPTEQNLERKDGSQESVF